MNEKGVAWMRNRVGLVAHLDLGQAGEGELAVGGVDERAEVLAAVRGDLVDVHKACARDERLVQQQREARLVAVEAAKAEGAAARLGLERLLGLDAAEEVYLPPSKVKAGSVEGHERSVEGQWKAMERQWKAAEEVHRGRVARDLVR